MSRNNLNQLKKLFIAVVFSLFILGMNCFAQDDAEKQAKEIYDKYLAAIGGKENLDKIETIETISEMDSGGEKSKRTVIEDKVNNKKYTVAEVGNNEKRESGFDGSRYWEKNPRYNGYRDFYLDDSINPKTLRKLPNETISGKEYFVLESKKTNLTIKAYFDAKTYLLVKKDVHGSFSGMTASRTVNFDDYRKVDEILVPFSQSFGRNGQEKFLSVRFNVKVDQKIFEYNNDTQKVGKETPKVVEQSSNQPNTISIDTNTIYKDENGNVVSRSEFYQRRQEGNFTAQPQISNGRITEFRLVKGNPETAIGAIAPDFDATLIDASPIQLSRLKGKVVVLNFWFVECAPCIKEMPELNELVKKYQGKEVEFLSITYNPKDQVTEFLKKHKFDYKHIVDAQNIIDLYKFKAFPAHIILDIEGKIKFVQFGFRTGTVLDLSKHIDSALY